MPRCLEKDFLQLTTDHKKAYGEGLPRPDGWEKDFLQLTTDHKQQGKPAIGRDTKSNRFKLEGEFGWLRDVIPQKRVV